MIFINRSVSTSGMTPNHWRSSPTRSSAVLVGTRSTGKGIWACADPPASNRAHDDPKRNKSAEHGLALSQAEEQIERSQKK